MEYYSWAQSSIAFCGHFNMHSSPVGHFSMHSSSRQNFSMHSSIGWEYRMYITNGQFYLFMYPTCAPLKTCSMYILELLKTILLDSNVSISIHYYFITFSHCNHKLQHWTHSSFSVKHNIHRNIVHMTQSRNSTLPIRIIPYSLRSKNLSLFTMKIIAYCSVL